MLQNLHKMTSTRPPKKKSKTKHNSQGPGSAILGNVTDVTGNNDDVNVDVSDDVSMGK